MTKTLDLFAGPGGWDAHDAELGLTTGRVENDPAARATAEAAGMHHAHDDVTTFKLRPGHGYTGLKGSPPCQTFSAAGNGAGRRQLEIVTRELYRLYNGHPLDYVHYDDARTGLVLEPMRVILDAWALQEPFRWLVLEQVPQVLPVWETYAGILRHLGYSVATGNLHAEQYGVPQTRKRAVLIASLDREVALPTPTHSKYYTRDPKRLDDGVLPWVSMAQALSGHIGEGLRSNYGTGGNPAARGVRTADQPAATVTGKIDRFKWQRMGDVRTGHGTIRDADQPAPTLTASMDNGNYRTQPGNERVTIQEAAVLQTFPMNYPWQGSKSQQYQQVGNAIPPLLAKTVLQQVI